MDAQMFELIAKYGKDGGAFLAVLILLGLLRDNNSHLRTLTSTIAELLTHNNRDREESRLNVRLLDEKLATTNDNVKSMKDYMSEMREEISSNPVCKLNKEKFRNH